MADAYPASIRGELDQGTNRFMFLVKWLLLIPHYVLLLFLGIASFFAWIAAAVAILFTGRYPRGLFDFMEGVMRWNWRVTFYGSVLGTDKYPPFSLDSDSGYPADLTVDYPRGSQPAPSRGEGARGLDNPPASLHHSLRLGHCRMAPCPRRDPSEARHRKLPAGSLRLHHGRQPLERPGLGLRELDDGQVPALQPF